MYLHMGTDGETGVGEVRDKASPVTASLDIDNYNYIFTNNKNNL